MAIADPNLSGPRPVAGRVSYVWSGRSPARHRTIRTRTKAAQPRSFFRAASNVDLLLMNATSSDIMLLIITGAG
jgi:hypothetical protein